MLWVRLGTGIYLCFAMTCYIPQVYCHIKLWTRKSLHFSSQHVTSCDIPCSFSHGLPPHLLTRSLITTLTLFLLSYTHTQFISADQITEKAPSGCYVSGLYLEGARWDTDSSCLTKSRPKVLIEELPILRVIPIEAHRLKLVVSKQCYPIFVPLWYLYTCSWQNR